MIDGRELVHQALVDAEERSGQVDVVAACQVLLESCTERQQRRHPSVGLDLSLARLEDPRQREKERALAGTVGSDDRERLAELEGQVDVAECPEVVLVGIASAQHPGQRPLERRPFGESQVVADPEVADLDGVDVVGGGRGGRCVGVGVNHQRIRANAGSARLKM